MAQDGRPVRLNIDLKKGSQPFIYAQAYIPDTVGGKLGWFAHSVDIKQPFGWKVVLTPQSRQDVLIRLGMKDLIVPVKSLRILSMSRTGGCLIAKVEEYLADDDYEIELSHLKDVVNSPEEPTT